MDKKIVLFFIIIELRTGIPKPLFFKRPGGPTICQKMTGRIDILGIGLPNLCPVLPNQGITSQREIDEKRKIGNGSIGGSLKLGGSGGEQTSLPPPGLAVMSSVSAIKPENSAAIQKALSSDAVAASFVNTLKPEASFVVQPSTSAAVSQASNTGVLNDKPVELLPVVAPSAPAGLPPSASTVPPPAREGVPPSSPAVLPASFPTGVLPPASEGVAPLAPAGAPLIPPADVPPLSLAAVPPLIPPAVPPLIPPAVPPLIPPAVPPLIPPAVPPLIPPGAPPVAPQGISWYFLVLPVLQGLPPPAPAVVPALYPPCVLPPAFGGVPPLVPAGAPLIPPLDLPPLALAAVPPLIPPVLSPSPFAAVATGAVPSILTSAALSSDSLPVVPPVGLPVAPLAPAAPPADVLLASAGSPQVAVPPVALSEQQLPSNFPFPLGGKYVFKSIEHSPGPSGQRSRKKPPSS